MLEHSMSNLMEPRFGLKKTMLTLRAPNMTSKVVRISLKSCEVSSSVKLLNASK